MTAGTLLQYLISAFLFFPSDSWVVRFGMTETGGAPILDSALQVHISRRRRRAGRVTSSVAGRYREGTGKVQGRYREGTGKVPEGEPEERRRRRAGRVTSSVARIRGGEGVGEKKGGARRGYSTHTTREAGGERATGAR